MAPLTRLLYHHSCNCAGCCTCLADGATVGDNQCNNPGECCTSDGGPLNSETGACPVDSFSCDGAKGMFTKFQLRKSMFADSNEQSDAFTKGPIGAGSCLVWGGCQTSRNPIGSNSCDATNSCKDFNSDAWSGTVPTGTIGDNSCLGESACFNSSGSIGNNSCQGKHSCNQSKLVTIGDGSCQCEHCCQCLAQGETVGDGVCNTPGECCNADGSAL